MSFQRRVDLLEMQLADLTARTAEARTRRPQCLGLARAALVGIACAVLTAAAEPGSQVSVPFEIVDDAGKPVFTVTDIGDTGIFLHDASGKPVVVGAVKFGNSYFKVQRSAQSAAMNQPATPGEPAARLATTPDEVVIGQLGGTTPGVNLWTQGKIRVAIAVANGKPSLNMGGGAVNMAERKTGGGLLQLGDSNGNEVVAFAVGNNGVGIVRAQPVGNVGVNVPRTGIFRGLGLPTSIICGLKCIHE